MDNLTKEQRSKNMRAIKSQDSAMELKLRRALWARGFRYRKNVKEIIGKPDIVFTKRKVAVFCDGEFWHGYNWEKRRNEIKSNADYWIKKISRNMERDKEVNEELTRQGWTVIRIWEKEIKNDLEGCLVRIEKALLASDRNLSQGYDSIESIPNKKVAEPRRSYLINQPSKDTKSEKAP